MADKPHEIRAQWRMFDADALEEKIKAIGDWLEHTEDLIEMFGLESDVSRELRQTTGLVRMRNNDLVQEAGDLRAQLLDRERG